MTCCAATSPTASFDAATPARRRHLNLTQAEHVAQGRQDDVGLVVGDVGCTGKQTWRRQRSSATAGTAAVLAQHGLEVRGVAYTSPLKATPWSFSRRLRSSLSVDALIEHAMYL